MILGGHLIDADADASFGAQYNNNRNSIYTQSVSLANYNASFETQAFSR